MREIKFRAKRVYDRTWVYGGLMMADDFCIIDQRNELYVEEEYKFRGDTHFFRLSGVMCDKETVGQYTGMKDVNGKEIYEGDILQSIKTNILVEVIYDAPEFCYKDNDFGYKFLNRPEEFEVVGNIHDKPESVVKKTEKNKGVALFGYPFLFQNGDLGFYEEMSKLGLSRGDIILGGLPNKCILANKYEYFLVDYYKEEDFCEQYKLKATYSVDDFIQGIKELKGETK